MAPLAHQLEERIRAVVKGKNAVVRQALACVFAEGHLLIEDVPGVGKTTLALSLAKTLGLSLQRIQFTADLLPADILGVSIYNARDNTFEFKPGPFSITSCWPTKSTAPPPKPKAPCSRP
jgi:MoxR-like ATPase